MNQTGHQPYLSRHDHPVDLVALLSDHLVTPFVVAAGTRHSVRIVHTLAELDTVLRTQPIDIAIIDPQAGPIARQGVAEIFPILARHPSVSVITYTTVSPDAVHACARLAAYGVRHVVLGGYDDDRTTFRELMETVRSDLLADAVLALIKPLLARLSPSVATAIAALMQEPHRVPDVDALARLAGTPRRTLDRALARAGLVPGWTLIRAARVVRAYHYLRGNAFRVRDAAAKLGYVRPEQLAEDVMLITGFLPSSLPRALDPDDLVARVAQRLRRVTADRTVVQLPTAVRSPAPADRRVSARGAPRTPSTNARPRGITSVADRSPRAAGRVGPPRTAC
jgi:AraC-like DNA-binding protein